MTVRVELYGRLREAGAGEAVELQVGESATAAEVLEALAGRLGAGGAWLKGAALATETEVLSPSSFIPKTGRLAVLPPVCGG